MLLRLTSAMFCLSSMPLHVSSLHEMCRFTHLDGSQLLWRHVRRDMGGLVGGGFHQGFLQLQIELHGADAVGDFPQNPLPVGRLGGARVYDVKRVPDLRLVVSQQRWRFIDA